MQTKTTGYFVIFLLLVLGVIVSCSRDQTKNQKNATDLRIVSGLPGITELIFALGAEEKLVGVTDFCNYPPAVEKITKTGGIVNPNYEIVVSLKPGIAMLQANQKDIMAKYHQLGIKTLLLDTSQIKGIFEAIEIISKTTKTEAKGKQLAQKLKSSLMSIRESVKGKKPVRALVVIGHDSGSLREIWAAGNNTFHNELLIMSGGENIVGSSPILYPTVSKETILKENPDAIILLSQKEMSEKEKNDELKLWSKLDYVNAVKNNKICILGGDWAFLPGPRMPKIARKFRDCLHSRI